MKNILLFMYIRGGSNLVRNHIQDIKPQEWDKKRQSLKRGDEHIYEPQGTLLAESPIHCPVQHLTHDHLKLIGEKQNSNLEYQFWYTYVWNWWGEETNSALVPNPYDGETLTRWGVSELNSLPGDWEFVLNTRDPRNHIESIIQKKTANHEYRTLEYFKVFCKGQRNRARIALDCRKGMSNYNITFLEDWVKNGYKTAESLFNFINIPMDKKRMQQKAIEVQTKITSFDSCKVINIDKHSTFGNAKASAGSRWKSWTPQQIDIFKEIAGNELIELGYETNNNW